MTEIAATRVKARGGTPKPCPPADSFQPPGNKDLYPTTTQRAAPRIKRPFAPATPLQKAPPPPGTPARPRAPRTHLLRRIGGGNSRSAGTATSKGRVSVPAAQDSEVSRALEAAIQGTEQRALSPAPKLRSTLQLTQPVGLATAPARTVRGISKKKWRQED